MNRRRFLGTAAGATAVAGYPAVLRAQTRELFVGGPSIAGFREKIFPVIEQKHNCKILYEGTRSFTNLEKMRANKDKPTMSVVLMDDPVMIIAQDEDLIERLPADKVPNIKQIKPVAAPRDGMWANYMQPRSSVAYNTTKVPGGLKSYAEMWDPKYKGRVILPSLQSTEVLWALMAAAHLETGKPMKDTLNYIDAGFKKLKTLKPNLLMIYNSAPQALNLLEQGEAWLVSGIDSRPVLYRKGQGAPVDLSKPKEGSFAMPAGIAKVKGGPHPDLSYAMINDFLGVELQSQFAGTFYSNPTHPKATLPPGFETGGDLLVPDWAFVTKNRQAWIDRWEREISAG